MIDQTLNGICFIYYNRLLIDTGNSYMETPRSKFQVIQMEPFVLVHFPTNWFTCESNGSLCYTLISELKMTLYKRESLGLLLVLIEMRHYFLKTI